MWEVLNIVVFVVAVLTVGACAALIPRERRVIVRLLEEQDPETYSRLGLTAADARGWGGEIQRYLLRREYRSSAIAGVREHGQRAWFWTMLALGAIALIVLMRVADVLRKLL